MMIFLELNHLGDNMDENLINDPTLKFYIQLSYSATELFNYIFVALTHNDIPESVREEMIQILDTVLPALNDALSMAQKISH